MKMKTLVLMSCMILAAGNVHAENLYTKYDGKSVKVYIADIQGTTQERVMDAQVLKAEVQKALAERRSIRFEMVASAEEADLKIETTVTDYLWSDHDPIDMLAGAGAIAADAAMIEDYARLQAAVTITDQRKSKVVWKDSIFASVTKKPMSQTESIPLVAEKFAKTFIKNCFSKKSK